MIDLDPVENSDAGLSLGACEQDGLEIDLVDTMRRLGCRPIGVRPSGCRVAILPRRNRDPRQLTADHGGPIGAVVWKVGWQAALPHLSDDTEASEHLHGTRGHVVALDVG